MVAKGIIRIKCVDLANWAARENIFNTIDENSPVRFATEGMDTVIVHVAKTDSVANLTTEFSEAMDICIEKFGSMEDNLLQLMNATNAVLKTNPCVITQSFKMQLNLPVSPYIEVSIKTVE